MTISQLLSNQLQSAHQVLKGTMEGVTNEVAQFQPEGTANPIAGTYAHLVFSEDMFVQQFLLKRSALFEDEYKDKTGASELHPLEWQTAYPKWLREVQLDMEAFNSYAAAVFAASETCIAAIDEAGLAQTVDMSAFGAQAMDKTEFISGYIIGHAQAITGEISVLKGIQGLKGYPF